MLKRKYAACGFGNELEVDPQLCWVILCVSLTGLRGAPVQVNVISGCVREGSSG